MDRIGVLPERVIGWTTCSVEYSVVWMSYALEPWMDVCTSMVHPLFNPFGGTLRSSSVETSIRGVPYLRYVLYNMYIHLPLLPGLVGRNLAMSSDEDEGFVSFAPRFACGALAVCRHGYGGCSGCFLGGCCMVVVDVVTAVAANVHVLDLLVKSPPLRQE
jgi:hypothetical protein